MQEFAGKVALICGAGTGLGREIALAFASLGSCVAANDINPINLDETVERILAEGGEAKPYVFDTAKRMPIEGMVAQVLDKFVRIDYLVNNASVMPDAAVLDMDEWEFHRTLDVNLGGPFFTMQQVGRVMRQQGGGAIVNMISGTRNAAFHKGHSAFSAGQAGLVALTQEAASELSLYNIRVNAVHSSFLEPFHGSSSAWDASRFTQWLETVPELHQGSQPGLVGRVVFLCSAAASSLNGEIITYVPAE